MATRKQYLSKLKKWSKINPGYTLRKKMWEKCGKKCFLGTRKSFPICRPDCSVHPGAVMSAYIRAKEMAKLSKQKTIKKHPPYYYNRISSRARHLIYNDKVYSKK